MSIFGKSKAAVLAKDPEELAPAALVCQDDDDVTQQFEKPGTRSSVITAQSIHIGTRKTQQDTVFVSESTSFFPDEPVLTYGVICDGMGGMADGAEAGAITVASLVRSLATLQNEAESETCIQEALLEADREIADRFGAANAGTTVVIALLFGRRFYWCSVGDSRIYLIREGEITQITRDHNYYLELLVEVAKGTMTSEDAKTHPDKEALISYIGSGDLTLIDKASEPVELLNGDIVLLCSDGLTKSLSDEQIASVVREGYGDLNETARLLPLVAFDTGGSKDNTSTILMQYFE